MSDSNSNTVAILGGTGDQGLGLALRFAKAGRPVVIGSRKAERAVEAADEVRAAVPGCDVSGFANEDACQKGDIVILSVPFEHFASTVKGIKEQLGAMRTIGIWQGSCAELVAGLVPKGVDVVSAFQNVSAHRLRDLENDVECDVVISGAKGPRQRVMELCPLVPGLRAVDGGPLSNARIVEEMTALLIGLNIRYKLPEGLGIRFTGLPE
jgi:NADPH-dependent F420 reductase